MRFLVNILFFILFFALIAPVGLIIRNIWDPLVLRQRKSQASYFSYVDGNR